MAFLWSLTGLSYFPLTPITGEPALSRMLRLFLAFLRPNRAMRCRGSAMSNPQSSGQPPMGHGERFPRDPFCRRAPEKRKSHFPLTPITGEPALSRMLRLFHRFADRLPRKLPDRKLSGVPWQIPQALSPVKRPGCNRITVRSSRAREDCSIHRRRRLACRI